MKYTIFILIFVLSSSFTFGQSLRPSSSLIRDMNVTVDLSKVKYLGFTHIDKIPGIYGDEQTISNIAANFENVNKEFHTFSYNDIFIIQTAINADLNTLNSNPSQNWELFYTLRTLHILETKYDAAYVKLIRLSINPNTTLLDNNSYNNYINKFSKILISFNTYSDSIAISGTQLGATNQIFTKAETNYTIYNNLPVISINSELIKGNDKLKGSYPIYKKEKPEDNFHLYMKEGLLHTIIHELTHRVTDVLNNKKRSIYNYISFGPGRVKINHSLQYPLYEIEEVLVSRTINRYFRKKGGISEELLIYYDNTEKQLVSKVGSFYYTYFYDEMKSKTEFNSPESTYTLFEQ